MVYYDTDWSIIVILAEHHKELSGSPGPKRPVSPFDAFRALEGSGTRRKKREEPGMKMEGHEAACRLGTFTFSEVRVLL
jgi:hypothetical protein